MKTKFTLLLPLILLITSIQAQTDNKSDSVFRRAHAVYAEIGGSGFLFSANYDFRFSKSQRGLGMRLGFGLIGSTNSGIVLFPIGINHLAGKAPNYFESGVGITYGKIVSDGSFFTSEGGSILVPNIGYRYQPLNNGLFVRVAISPLINLGKEGGWIFWGGVGVGFKF